MLLSASKSDCSEESLSVDNNSEINLEFFGERDKARIVLDVFLTFNQALI